MLRSTKNPWCQLTRIRSFWLKYSWKPLRQDSRTGWKCFRSSWLRDQKEIEAPQKQALPEMLQSDWSWRIGQYHSRLLNFQSLAALLSCLKGRWSCKVLEVPFWTPLDQNVSNFDLWFQNLQFLGRYAWTIGAQSPWGIACFVGRVLSSQDITGSSLIRWSWYPWEEILCSSFFLI